MHDRDRCCREAWPRKKTTATITATRTKSTPYVDTTGPRAGGDSFSLQRNYIDRVTNNDPITDAELDEMQRRADAAVEGPWHAFVEGPDDAGSSCIFVRDMDDEFYLSPQRYANSAPELNFIAAARQDVPRLIAEVRRLRRELDLATRPT